MKDTIITKADMMLQLAEQQIRGFAHASKGFTIRELIESMGMEKSEWEAIKDQAKILLNDLDFEDIENHFNNI